MFILFSFRSNFIMVITTFLFDYLFIITGQKFVFRAMCFPTSSCRLESVMHSNRASLFQIRMILSRIFMIIWLCIKIRNYFTHGFKIRALYLACCPTFPSKCKKPTRIVKTGNLDALSLVS